VPLQRTTGSQLDLGDATSLSHNIPCLPAASARDLGEGTDTGSQRTDDQLSGRNEAFLLSQLCFVDPYKKYTSRADV